jgi:hypothetical protein
LARTRTDVSSGEEQSCGPPPVSLGRRERQTPALSIGWIVRGQIETGHSCWHVPPKQPTSR